MDTPNKRRRHNEESLGSTSSWEISKNSNLVENGKNFNSVFDAPETPLPIVAVPESLDDGGNHVTDINVLQKNSETDIVPNSAPKVPFRSVQQSSSYHGVTRHRTTGRFEASLWDKSLKNEGKSRKGKQVYLGVYDTEEKAAKAYDLTALKYFGPSAAKLNFPISDYEKQLEEMKDMTRDEFVCSIRRKSTCFSRGTSIYRGVTRHRREGSKWQARIGRLTGTKELHLGSFDTEEEAAIAYDLAAVELRGLKAVTNFDISNYIKGNPQLTEEFTKLKEIAQAKSKPANQA